MGGREYMNTILLLGIFDKFTQIGDNCKKLASRGCHTFVKNPPCPSFSALWE
jgi:hypothetical protein